MSARPGAPLPDDATVLRVLKPLPLFFEPPALRQPTRKAFEPTAEDLAGDPPGVSVFDLARTTFSEAVAIREAQSGRPLGAPLPVHLSVQSVRQLATTLGAPMDAIADPIDALPLPGADGHALLTGLARGPGEATVAYKNRLAAVARAAWVA